MTEHEYYRLAVTEPAIQHARTAIDARPDADQIHRVRHAVDRAKQAQNDVPVLELAVRLGLSEAALVSHLRTLHAAGYVQSIAFYADADQEMSVGILRLPHGRIADEAAAVLPARSGS